MNLYTETSVETYKGISSKDFNITDSVLVTSNNSVNYI